MKAIWVGAGVLVFAAFAAGAYVAVRSNVPDLGPAGPNRELAPESIAVYLETSDARATWSKMQTTEAWRDFAASKAAAALLELPAVKDVVAAVEQVATKAAYPVDAANAMKFLGRELSIGVELDADGGAPRVLVLTKLDVDALTKDLVSGKTDLGALWDELQRRTGQCDFQVTREEHRGHAVAVAARGAAKFHAALLGDTLAVSDDGGLLRRAIDCRVAGGERSLGRRPAFQADVASTTAGATAFEWYDFDALDARRASLDAGLASVGASPELVGAAHAVLDGVRGAHSCARSTTIVDGDLYKLTWKYSKAAELFADKASPPLRDLYFGDWIVFAEVREVGAVVAAWNKSALRKRLGAGEAGSWLRGFLDDPASRFAELESLVGGIEAPDPDEDASIEQSPAKLKDKYLDRFATRFAWHVVSDRIDAIVGGDAAVGISSLPKKKRGDDLPRFACAVRLDPETRLIALAAQGGLVASKKSRVKSEDCGSRKVFSVKAPGGSVLWTLVGDALVASNDADLVRQAARAGDVKPLGPPQRVRDAADAMKPGWRGFLYMDMDRFIDEVKGSGGVRPDQAMAEVLDQYRSTGLFGGQVAAAAYVPDDFSAVEVRTRQWLPEPKDEDWRRCLERSEPREPRCWSALPESTFAHATAPSAGVDMLWFLFKFVVKSMHADLASMENDFRESMGMDLEKELIPALGREVFFAATYHAAAPAKPGGRARPVGASLTLPGFVFGVELKDVATVKKAVDRALELAEEAIRESDPSSSASPFVRETREGAEIVRLELPPEMQESLPVRPALAIHDGYLIVSSDVDALRAGVDARNGKAKSLADTPVFARAAAGLDKKCASFALLDWSKALDQIAAYEEHLGGLFAHADAKFPDPPANGDVDEWQRRMKEFEEKRAARAASGAEKARKWIAAARVVDFIGLSTRIEGRTSDSTTIVRFAE